MNKRQIPRDCGMPEYRAHLAGPAALIVEFGEQINERFRAWDLARGRWPTEVNQHDMAKVLGVAG